MTNTTTEAVAHVIDSELAKPSEFESWLAVKSEQVSTALAAAPQDVSEITSVAQYKGYKAAAADLNRLATTINDERKLKVAALNTLISRVKAETDGVISPIRERADALKREINAADEREAADKLAQLERSYNETAPALVPLVPFDKVVSLIGSKWANKSCKVGQANRELLAFVEDVAKSEKLIDSLNYTDSDKRELKALFFSTLDLAAAQQQLHVAKQQREELAKLEQLRAEHAQPQEPTQGAESAEPEAFRVFRVTVPESKLTEFIAAMRSVGAHGQEIKA